MPSATGDCGAARGESCQAVQAAVRAVRVAIPKRRGESKGRWLGPDPPPSVRPSAGALEDLERAVALSGGRGRAARQGFVQRGLLARLQGRDDDARGDFERAARLGSSFARRQLVLLNPYAALCNRMLADVMKQLHGPRNGR